MTKVVIKEGSIAVCGRKSCNHLCSRSIYCQAGQERVLLLLGQQRERRESRRQWSVVGQAIEAAVPVFAGSFQKFQQQLAWERKQLEVRRVAVSAPTGSDSGMP